MSKSAKNLVVVLGIITIAFAGYYFFTQEAALVLRTGESDQQLAELLRSAETFTARQQVLDSIELDTAVFESPVFTALRSYAPAPDEFGIGRDDPFAPAVYTAPVNRTTGAGQ